MSSPCLDGKQGFDEVLNYLPRHLHPNVLRLDQAIDGPLPRLDDVEAIDDFSQMDFSVGDELVRKVIARGLFFFELDDMPIRTETGFACTGSVFCSRPGAPRILECLAAEFPSARLQISEGRSLGTLSQADCCQHCGYFRKGISFLVSSMEERVAIRIASDRHNEMIGGFPKCASELLREQHVFAPFGRADHRDPEWPRTRSCFCVGRTKRRIQIVEPPVACKKRRL